MNLVGDKGRYGEHEVVDPKAGMNISPVIMGCNHFICNLPSRPGCILSFPSAWLLFLQADKLSLLFFHLFLTNIVDEPLWAGHSTSYTLPLKSRATTDCRDFLRFPV